MHKHLIIYPDITSYEEATINRPQVSLIEDTGEVKYDNVLNPVDRWYGIQFDIENESSLCTRIGNMNLHRSLPVHSKMKGCLLADNGTVNEYLEGDWSNYDLSGESGQVMIEIPEHYRRFETVGNIYKCKIAEEYIPGFHRVPKMYISAYQASLQHSTNKLSSVMNMSEDYRGGANIEEWDGIEKSLLGMPFSRSNRETFRQYARNRGDGWEIWNYPMMKNLSWLYIVEYANRAMYLPLNNNLTSEGFRQGGLGNGTYSKATEWSTFNGYNPYIKCGELNEFGNNTGGKIFPNPVWDSTFLSKYRGLESINSILSNHMDGANILTTGGVDNLEAYVCDDHRFFSDTMNENYRFISGGFRVNVSEYVRYMKLGEYGDLINGSTLTGYQNAYWHAQFWRQRPIAGDIHTFLNGGSSDSGQFIHSLWSANVGWTPQDILSSTSRLCYFTE